LGVYGAILEGAEAQVFEELGEVKLPPGRFLFFFKSRQKNSPTPGCRPRPRLLQPHIYHLTTEKLSDNIWIIIYPNIRPRRVEKRPFLKKFRPY
jgi:hypothetical protein